MSVHLTDAERETLCLRQYCYRHLRGDEWVTTHASECENHSARVERILTTRLAAVEAERDRLAAAVERVESLADLLIEQGDEHVPGCMGQADCAACVHADLRAALSDAGRGK